MNIFAKLDIVPVDFVADSISTLMFIPEAVNQTYHLTAGRGHEQSLYRIAKEAASFLQVRPYPIIPIWLYKIATRSGLFARILGREVWEILKLFEAYTTYFAGASAKFNAKKTHDLLAKYGVQCPRWDEYKAALFQYCLDSKFGKVKRVPEFEYYRMAINRSRQHNLPVKFSTNLTNPLVTQ